MTRVLVCGGRDFADEVSAWNALSRLFDEIGEPSMIIHGGAPGADSIAEDYAQQTFCRSHVFRANWKKHGKSAGPIRNQRMIDEGRPELVVAFPGGRGTADMVRRARAANIEVIEVAPSPKQVERAYPMPSITPHSIDRAASHAAVGTARREGRGLTRRASLAGGVGKAFDASLVLPLRDQPRGEVVELVPAAIGVAIRVRGIGARCVVPALGVRPARGVLEKLKLVFSCVFHALKSRRGKFRDVRKSFGEIRNV